MQFNPTTSLLCIYDNFPGLWSGSLYIDDTLKNNGFRAERMRARYVSVVKTHEPRYTTKDGDKFEAAIILMRSPYDTLVASYHFVKTHWNHTGSINATMFNATGKCSI